MSGWELLPGRGLGPLLFGMTVAEVEQLLGPASDSIFEEDGEYSYVQLSYHAEAIFPFFHKESEFRLDSIEIEPRGGFVLFGEPLFSMHRGSLVSLLERHLPQHELDSAETWTLESSDQTALWIESLDMSFYFDSLGILTEVQWGPVVARRLVEGTNG
jgi:hypothetical protein